MVIVDIEVAFDVDFHTETAVDSDLIQHMIKEANAGVNLAATFAIQPYLNVNLRLFGVAHYMGVTVSFGELFANHRPVQGFAVVA